MDCLFVDWNVAQHVYYVVGFLCHAGAKETKRHTTKNDVGLCINALHRHFSSDNKMISDFKAELPDGLTNMVDQHCAYGGLKYPNKHLYRVFSLIKLVYSHLANPDNFTIFGGRLLAIICSGMIENSTIVSLFSNLFVPDEFLEEKILVTLQYYLKVFGNVRAKDLCYRYNSNLNKSATVELRQTLAAGTIKNSRPKLRKTKKLSDVALQKKSDLPKDNAITVLDNENEILPSRKDCAIHPTTETHMEE